MIFAIVKNYLIFAFTFFSWPLLFDIDDLKRALLESLDP